MYIENYTDNWKKINQITFYFPVEGPGRGSEDFKKECNVNCFHFGMYMSYRWRESLNTVRSPSDSWRHHNGDWHVWAQNAERKEGGGDGPYIRRGAD